MSGVVACLDSFSILLAGIVTYLLLLPYIHGFNGEYIAAILFFGVVCLLCFRYLELYNFQSIIHPRRSIDKLSASFLIAFSVLTIVGFSFKISANYSRLWVACFAASAAISTICTRLVVAKLALRLSDRRMVQRHVVILGQGAQSRRLLGSLQTSGDQFISVVGVFGDYNPADGSTLLGVPILGDVADMVTFIRGHPVDDVVISLPWSAEDETMTILDRLRELPVNVYLGADLVGLRLDLRQPPSHFGALPIFEVIGRPMSDWGRAAKRLEDLVIGSIATLALMPLMVVIAILIRLDSPGPAIFRQTRLGLNNVPFEIYKFRTMRADAGDATATLQAIRRDPRVTRVGQFLRRTSLDELPQLFNVLHGTMSLVGPRPHAVDHNEAYSQRIRWYFARHRVKPGMTGWAQVNGLRGETATTEKMEARVKYDIYYTENWSILFDLWILARTALIVMSAHNAY
jgi:Undecaprenyl-phosphate glucose phosphotransferase